MSIRAIPIETRDRRCRYFVLAFALFKSSRKFGDGREIKVRSALDTIASRISIELLRNSDVCPKLHHDMHPRRGT